MSGCSPALRLTERRELTAKEVRLELIGHDIWLHPETSPEQNRSLWLQEFYAATQPLPADDIADRQDLPAQKRRPMKDEPIQSPSCRPLEQFRRTSRAFLHCESSCPVPVIFETAQR